MHQQAPYSHPHVTSPRRGPSRRTVVLAVIGAILLIPLSCGAIFAAAFTAIHNSDAVHMALERAQADPRVEDRLGAPIETGFASGSLKTENGRGSAELTLPVEGPRGEGVLLIEARKAGGDWVLTGLVLEQVHSSVDLLGEHS